MLCERDRETEYVGEGVAGRRVHVWMCLAQQTRTTETEINLEKDFATRPQTLKATAAAVPASSRPQIQEA